MKSKDVYKCPKTVTNMRDVRTKQVVRRIEMGPFRDHLFNDAEDRNKQKCMRCGAAR